MSHKKVWFLKPKSTFKFCEKSAGILKRGNRFFCVLGIINWQVLTLCMEVSRKKCYDEKTTL